MALIDQSNLEVKLERWDTIYRGTTPTWTQNVEDAEGEVGISGYDIWCTAKYELDDGDGSAVFQKSVGDGITITDADTGEFEILLEEGDTTDVDPEEVELYFDIKIKSPGGAVEEVFVGTLLILPNVTITS